MMLVLLSVQVCFSLRNNRKLLLLAILIFDEVSVIAYSFTDKFCCLQVREAQLAQYNYILVVGEEEANTGKVLPLPYN